MPQEEDGTPATDNQCRAADATTYTEHSRTCNRRYSEVMREYIKTKRRRNGGVDETNIKPSEVLTHQADHSGPNGCSYVKWDNPDIPGMLSLDTLQVPVMEEPCQVSTVQTIHCSPHLSPYSPVTPESGTESFSTAKTHFSNSSTSPAPSSTHISSPKSAALQLPSQANTNFAERHFSPHDDTTLVGKPSSWASECQGVKTPVIGQNRDDCVRPKPTESDENRCLAGQCCEFGSRPFLVNPNRFRLLRPESHSTTCGEESMNRDVSRLRETVHDTQNLLHPSVLDFDQDFLISDQSQCHEEPVGMPSYPPDEDDTTSYNLKQTSSRSLGSGGSAPFSWLPSKRQGSCRITQTAINTRLRKLKRLQRVGCGLIILSILLFLIAVLTYFMLDTSH